MTNTVSPYLKTLAQKCVERVDGLHLGNKHKAADAALHFFLGASVAYETLGDIQKAKHIATVAGLLIATRGMAEVRELAAG